MTEKQRLKEFLDMQTCSPTRVRKIQTILANSKKLLGKDLTKLKLSDVAKFLREINNSEYTEWTRNDYKKIFRAFIKWQYKQDFLEWMENKSIQDGFRCASRKRAFNKERINKETLIKPEELEKLLRTAKTLKWKALVTLMYESAFRPCELVSLKWKDLTFNDSKGICSVKTISPKTKDTRTVPVKDCIVHLKRWREEFEYPNQNAEDFVFPAQRDRAKHMSEAGVGVLLKRLCKAAKIRPLFPYMFRHSRIYFIQKRLGARIASKYAGHSLETSQIYDHLDSDDVEEAMLEKVYVTEELTEEEKAELEELKKAQQAQSKELAFTKLALELFFRNKQGKISDKEFDKEMEDLLFAKDVVKTGKFVGKDAEDNNT